MSDDVFALCGTRRVSELPTPSTDAATRLSECSRKLGHCEGAQQQDQAMRWPYRAQGAIVGGLFVALCFVGAEFL